MNGVGGGLGGRDMESMKIERSEVMYKIRGILDNWLINDFIIF